MPSCSELSEVSLTLYKGTYPRLWPGHFMVEMVVGLKEETSGIREGYAPADESYMYERKLLLPSAWPERLAQALRTTSYNTYNCHRFSRDLLGISGGGMQPLVTGAEGVTIAEAFELGELGVIRSSAAPTQHGESKTLHSMIGLGEQAPGQSIQVMDTAGELAIAVNSLVLGYYQKQMPDALLYRVDSSVYEMQAFAA